MSTYLDLWHDQQRLLSIFLSLSFNLSEHFAVASYLNVRAKLKTINRNVYILLGRIDKIRRKRYKRYKRYLQKISIKGTY